MRFLLSSQIIALILTCLELPAQAQVQFGSYVGLNRSLPVSEVDSSVLGEQIGSKPLWRERVGVLMHVPVGRLLAIQAGLGLSQKGERVHEKTAISFSGGGFNYELSLAVRGHLRILYAELPVVLVVEPDPRRGFQLLAGGYGAIGLGGRAYTKVQTSNTLEGDTTAVFDKPVQFGTYWDDVAAENTLSSARVIVIYGPIRRLDAGLIGGMGYRHQRWQAQLTYQYGLRNIAPKMTSGPATAHHRVLSLTVAYLFPWPKSATPPDSTPTAPAQTR